jgi:transcriptional regulator with PAS, ATPase and Fis domain
MDSDLSGLNSGFSQHQVKQDGPRLDEKNTPLDWQRIFNGDVDLSATISPQDIIHAWNRFKEQTLTEWSRFISGAEDIDTSVIPEDILSGWRKARSNRIDPLGEPQAEVLQGDDLQRLLDDNKTLIDTSRPFLNRLFHSMKTTSFSVSLFNRDGYILQVMHHERYEDMQKLFKWYPGVCWSETYCGNNAVGTVLALKKPLQIIGPQHYLQWCHSVTASSAPIFDPDGRIIGGITIVALLFGTHPHTLGMAIAASHAIENELKIQKAMAQLKAAFEETDIAYSLQKAIITSIPEALIAVNNERRIIAVNTRARKLFFEENQDMTGKWLCDIFKGDANKPFLDLIERHEMLTDTEVRIHLPKGSADFTLTCNGIFSSTGSSIGKILVFSEIQRIKSLVNKFSGAKANLKFADIHGKNERFKRLLAEAAVISKSASNVLLLGESGTGKDIMAQAIHNGSPRRDGPYVAINCAAIPRDLIASELFGYSEGAFTGSRRGGSQGKFEMADGGTIFLDEIAETPLEIQAVLLRVIEDKSVIRIGGNQIRSVDVRIIAATNKDLIEEVNKGNFRKDLYYRLNVFNIHLPPLRERTDDIPLLTDVFIRKYEAALGKTIASVDEKVWEVFMQYSWPGNIRELQNVVERMVNYATTDRLTANLIPAEIVGISRPNRRHLDLESPEDTEKRLIRHMLALKFSKVQIAEQLNVSRATLFRKMKKYGLTKRTSPS